MNVPEISIRRPVMTTMLVASLVVAGIVTYPRTGINFFPRIESPAVTVLTLYPGAGPTTVESEVTDPIEESIGELSGVREIRSTSAENVSSVFVVFESSVDHRDAVQSVRDRVARLQTTLPRGVESPTIERYDLDALPIMTLAVGGPGSPEEVTRFARERIKEPLQTLEGVGSISIVGGQEPEIKVWIDRHKLEAAQLSVTDVVGVIGGSNLEYPGGELDSGDKTLAVKVDGQFGSIEEIEDLVVMDYMGQSVRVKDVARVQMSVQEAETMAALDGRRAVTLLVRKQSGSNAVAVADRIASRLADLDDQLPEGWTLLVASDMTRFTKESFHSVQFDMLYGLILCVLIVFLFLRNVSATVIAGLAIPTSVVGTVAFMHVMGFTFNFMTLMAITLSIGVLIDDAIVVLENIYRHMERGKSVLTASLEGSREIQMAVFATTISIVAVFLPVALAEGMIGYMLYEFGLTVSVAVLLSLVVSFTLTPMMASRILTEPGDNVLYRTIEKILTATDTAYRRTIRAALRHRVLTILAALAVFAGSLGLVSLLGLEFVPGFDQGGFTVNVEMPVGTTLERTAEVAESYAVQIREHTDMVAGTVTSIGADTQRRKNLAQIWVKLRDRSERPSQKLSMERLRSALTPREGAGISIEEPDITGGGLGNYQIVYNLRGNDLDELSRISRALARRLEATEGFRDVDTTYSGGKLEVHVRVDQRRAAGSGIITATLGEAIRCFVAGVEASKFRSGKDEIPILVKLDTSEFDSTSQLASLRVRSSTSGKLVPISSVADVITDTGPTQIDHQERTRQISVRANLSQGIAQSDAAAAVERITRELVPDHIVTEWGGQVKMQRESFGDFYFYLILSIIVVYMVLASQFEHLLHPLTIMVSLPLSLVGAFAALIVTGRELSLFAMFGMIMLIALVTKNAILLVDYTNTLRRRDGMARNEALITAGPTRLRPILMTAVGTIFGMIPVAISQGWGSELRSPMAICSIGGLATSTVLTLVVVPVVYSLFDDLAVFVTRIFRRGRDTHNP